MKRDDLVSYLNEQLTCGRFKDYCPNGLQVEGCSEVQRVVAGVTASQALLDAAVAAGADTVLVHHGYFWRGEDGRVTGMRKRRLATLLRHDINLLAYHLPLDAHPLWGNNAQLAARMGWMAEGNFGDQDIAWFGSLPAPLAPAALAAKLEAVLGRPALCLDDGQARPIRRIGWCSGGAQGYFEQAIALGLDAYVSGEVSEQTTHLARESGVTYFACGHHATECLGVAALAGHLATAFGLDCQFVDIANPV